MIKPEEPKPEVFTQLKEAKTIVFVFHTTLQDINFNFVWSFCLLMIPTRK